MTAEVFRGACVQLCSGADVEDNIAQASDLIREAAAGGAQFVVTPECTHIIELSSKGLFAKVKSQEADLGLAAFRGLAKELGLWLVLGSLPIKLSATKVANRSFLLGPQGQIIATYDKIHMFDVDLAGGERHRESKNFQPGERAVVAQTALGNIGLSICYDLRFSHLYRALAQAGAQIVTVPAAFTQQTGEAHWHSLLRARAIETGCYVFAPGQSGTHHDGRKTYGHSLIIDPWGKILAESEDGPGVIFADMNLAKVVHARAKIPSLEHDRPFKVEKA